LQLRPAVTGVKRYPLYRLDIWQPGLSATRAADDEPAKPPELGSE
jgi:hypothetical protein